jgi:hypothetical protein
VVQLCGALSHPCKLYLIASINRLALSSPLSLPHFEQTPLLHLDTYDMEELLAAKISDDKKCLLEADLEIAWHFQREELLRVNLRDKWSCHDYELINLSAGVSPCLPHLGLLNKPTAFYFEQSSQYGCYDEVYGYPCRPSLWIAASYEAWRARSGRELDIEFGHFLANPVRITKQGLQSSSEIAAFHLTISDMAKGSGLEDDRHQLLPSYPAVFLVADRGLRQLPADIPRDDDGLFSLRDFADKLTILVVRTGALSLDQFTLEELGAHALPLEQSDADGLDVRRVPLSIAIDFIVNLEERTNGPREWTVREYDSKLGAHRCPKGFDWSVTDDPKTWIAALNAASTAGDSQTAGYIQYVLERSAARAAGTSCDWDLEFEWRRDWKSGYDDSGPERFLDIPRYASVSRRGSRPTML